MRRITNNGTSELEQLVDQIGLVTVIKALSQICVEKAQRVERTWQDNPLAGMWVRAAVQLDKVATHPSLRKASGHDCG